MLSFANMNLALKLTIFRILLGPIFVLCFIKTGEQPKLLWVALALAFISELSDLLDGIIARRYNMVTDLGKVLDPLADSISRLSIFLAFFQMGHANIWMILIFFYRDSLVSTLRIVAASRSLILSARKSGKIKAVVQAISVFGVILTLLASEYSIPLYFTPDQIIFVFMSLAVIITLYSLWDYLYSNRPIISELLN